MINKKQIMRDLIILATIFSISCSENKKHTNPNSIKHYYLATQNYNETIDTIPYNLGYKVDSGSIFQGAFHFRYKYNNSMHELRKYVYFDKADSTSGTTSYTLDNLGVIYNKSNYYKS